MIVNLTKAKDFHTLLREYIIDHWPKYKGRRLIINSVYLVKTPVTVRVFLVCNDNPFNLSLYSMRKANHHELANEVQRRCPF